MSDELCETGQRLWDSRFEKGEYIEKNYKEYVKHITACDYCRRELGITMQDVEVLRELDEKEQN